jgi:cysteine desulfurase/selenocysteine lyase
MNAPFLPTGAAPFDVEAIRAEFPILSQQVYGKPLVYLDSAASAQKPRAVIDAMVRTMETGYANVHRGLHYMANAATEGFEEARESVRAFLNAGSVDEIVFTKSATEAYNLVASSFGLMGLGEGDEIILSIMEHHSNIVPWHFLRERKGAVIKWAPIDDEGNFLVDEYESFSRRAPRSSRSRICRTCSAP